MRITKSNKMEKINKLTRVILTCAFLLVLTGCAGMGMPNRTYIDQMDHETDGFFVAGQDFPVVSGDQSVEGRSRAEIGMRTPASARSKKAVTRYKSVREELVAKLNNLTEHELNDYNRAGEFLPTDSDKIYYLNLPKHERLEYLMSRGYSPEISKKYLQDKSEGKGMSFFESRAVKVNDISMGMSKNNIISSWGQPNRVDVAGNPVNQNERWSYYESGKVRQVFFESGRVEGWSIE
jgi:hypothetical protein